MIRFSIVTITYNAASVLQPTLDSVASQTFRQIEHIIVDGASTDGTVDIAKEYKIRNDADEEMMHDVVVMSEPDKGLYDAMNKGIRVATGNYILFLNAGDTFPSADTLENIGAVVGEGETLPSVLYGDTDIVDNEGNVIGHRHHSAPARLTWRSFMRGMLVCHQAFYARTDLAKLTLYNLHYRFSADVDWCIRIMKLGSRQGLQTRNTGMVVAHFLEGGMSRKNHRDSLKERFKIMCRHYGLLTTLVMHLWFVVRAFGARFKICS